MCVCVFMCNLPPALLAEWPGSFICRSGNTGVERTPNKSQHTKLTLEKKILPSLLPGFELATFRSRVRCSTSKLPRLPAVMLWIVHIATPLLPLHTDFHFCALVWTVNCMVRTTEKPFQLTAGSQSFQPCGTLRLFSLENKLNAKTVVTSKEKKKA